MFYSFTIFDREEDTFKNITTTAKSEEEAIAKVKSNPIFTKECEIYEYFCAEEEEEDSITAREARVISRKARARMREEAIEAAENTFKNEISSAIRRAARDGDRHTIFQDMNLIKDTTYYSCIIKLLQDNGFEVFFEEEFKIGIYW